MDLNKRGVLLEKCPGHPGGHVNVNAGVGVRKVSPSLKLTASLHLKMVAFQ